MSGRVVHFEIPADDVARAQEFYRTAFGWTITPMPQMDYTIVSTAPSDDQGTPTEPGAINGGMFTREGALRTPVITVEVDDIDEALKNVELLGGRTAVPRTPVGDMGFTAYFTDSEGNLMGMWQNADAVSSP